MIAAREDIYAALWAKIIAATGVKNNSRILQHWSQIDAANMPAIFLAQSGEVAKAQLMTGLPTIWNASVKVYVYTSVGNDPNASPATQLNVILDAIEKAIAPLQTGERSTLGGLVLDCRINGKVETDEGTMGSNAVAIVPIEIVA